MLSLMSCLVYNSIFGYYAICEYAFNYVPVIFIVEKFIVLIMLIKFGNILIV